MLINALLCDDLLLIELSRIQLHLTPIAPPSTLTVISQEIVSLKKCGTIGGV